MNRKLLVLTVALIAVATLATPVMAIGPWQGAEASGNDNFEVKYAGLLNDRGKSSGSQVWAFADEGYWVVWRWANPLVSKGLMNSAIVPQNPAQLLLYGGEDYANKWIYLSGDGPGKPAQFQFPATGSNPTIPYAYLNSLGPHGELYWLFFFAFGKSAAEDVASEHPQGSLWAHNNIYTAP